MDENVDYASIYRSLNAETKKGIFKKQNRSASSEDFAFASKTLAAQNCPDLAGLFLLGKAKCESNSKNPLAEASSLLTSAVHFLKQENSLACINAVTYGENLDCASQSLLKAAKLYESCDMFSLAVNAYCYLADILMRYQRWSEALPHLKRTLEYLSGDTEYHISIMRKILTCQLHMHEWPGALTSCINIQKLLRFPDNPKATCDDVQIWHTAEAVRVCLVLITVPPRKLANITDTGACLESYSIDREPMSHMDTELYLHLQSLVLAYRSEDALQIKSATTALQPFFHPNDLILLDLLNR